MLKVSIRDLTHNFSKYLKTIKGGERLLILERNKPVAEIIPHNDNVTVPAWRRELPRLSLKGESLSNLIVKERKETGR